MANEGESRRWNDQRWTDAWPSRERLTDAVTPYLIDAAGVQPGQRVCDIGCGGGGLTITLGRMVGPDSEVVGFDVSAALLELARERAARSGASNVRFVEADVQVSALNSAPFDVAISQFGVMFFDEPTAAFVAIRELLVPDGRLVFACWQGVERNPWHTGTALRKLLPPPRTPEPGKSPVGPFALGDDEYVRELLEAAGYVGIEGSAYETKVRAPASAVVDTSLLSFMGVAPEREDEAIAILDAHLAQFVVVDEVEDDLYEFPLAFMVYEAHNS
ncbi:MAG TPA: methyltransferase domain-containing protein [Acidimicrobiales bacterium]|nr:methyltransferase domain-containing protein [Acidimicrobiales bacterium]